VKHHRIDRSRLPARLTPLSLAVGMLGLLASPLAARAEEAAPAPPPETAAPLETAPTTPTASEPALTAPSLPPPTVATPTVAAHASPPLPAAPTAPPLPPMKSASSRR